MTEVVTRYRKLAEMAVNLLSEAGQPQSSQALAGQLLGPAFARQERMVQMIEQVLAGDARFGQESGGRWGLAGWTRDEPRLADQDFTAVDVETTGGQSDRHRIVEVAAVKLSGGRIRERYTSLVNPLQPLPRFVAQFSGITPEMVEDAPPADEVLGHFREFVGTSILVAHNVACDLTFLNYEAVWHGLPPFGNPALDTQELAERLLPHVRRPSLARIAAELGLSQPLQHRALPDAQLTAHVLVALLGLLDLEVICTFSQLQQWLSDRLAVRQERVRRVRTVLPAGTLRALPDQPGVYTFKDVNGRALYVGKAVSLHNRVAQHFTGASRVRRLDDGLLERTAQIDHEVADCELDALLLESARIRTLQPPYNVQERSRQGCPFLRFEDGLFPRVAAARRVEGDTSHFVGPYRTTRDVQRTLRTLRRVFQLRSCRRRLPAVRQAMRVPCLRLGQQLCPAPCADLVTPKHYHVLVEYARLFVKEGKTATLEALGGRLAMLKNTGAEHDWEVGMLAECRSRLLRVRKEYRPLDGGLAGGKLVMAYPSATGGMALFFVQDGRLTRRTHISASQTSSDALRSALSASWPAPHESEQGELDVDCANILLRWIYHHIGRPELFPAHDTFQTAQTAAGDVRALLPVRPPVCEGI